MRCLNKSGNRLTYNRHSLEGIEETRGNTATHHPLTTSSTANSANQRPTTPTLTTHRLYAYIPSDRINRGLFLMAITEPTIVPGHIILTTAIIFIYMHRSLVGHYVILF